MLYVPAEVGPLVCLAPSCTSNSKATSALRAGRSPVSHVFGGLSWFAKAGSQKLVRKSWFAKVALHFFFLEAEDLSKF